MWLNYKSLSFHCHHYCKIIQECKDKIWLHFLTNVFQKFHPVVFPCLDDKRCKEHFYISLSWRLKSIIWLLQLFLLIFLYTKSRHSQISPFSELNTELLFFAFPIMLTLFMSPMPCSSHSINGENTQQGSTCGNKNIVNVLVEEPLSRQSDEVSPTCLSVCRSCLTCKMFPAFSTFILDFQHLQFFWFSFLVPVIFTFLCPYTNHILYDWVQC